jgi:hypothetical protein
MSPFSGVGTVEEVEKYIGDNTGEGVVPQRGSVESVIDKRNEKMREVLAFWDQEIEKGFAGEYGQNYISPVVEGAQQMVDGHGTLFVVNEDSLLKSELAKTLEEKGFKKTVAGTRKTIYSKVLKEREPLHIFERNTSL